tara:strand:+ start:5115 stop:5762 length:648 start_codon:yes stop_codon:yes gene_type:complete
MPTALSLFYDPEWLQKHHDRMPAGLANELLKITGWGGSNIASKIWTAYLRNPEYLFRFESAGREGREKSEIPEKIIEYYDWIYAPLIEIKPELEKNLKKILFRKDGDDGWVGKPLYYWSVSDMHQGGVDNVLLMPLKTQYQKQARRAIAQNNAQVYPFKTKKFEINKYLIPRQMMAQTGWKSWAFKNNSGIIPLFTYDFNIQPPQFLNWRGNPFA